MLSSAAAVRLPDGRVQVSYVLTNSGASAAIGVTATSAKLLGVNGSAAATSAGPVTLAPGATLSGTAIFPASVTAASRTFQLYGSSSGASYSCTKTVTVP